MTTVGDYELTYVTEGHCWLDGGAMFGVVPKTLWQRATSPDEKNRIQLACHSLIIKGNGKVIVVDTGCGDKWDEKSKKIYRIEMTEGGLVGALAAKGIKAEEVTDVVYTHLHFDHAGGGTIRQADGSCVPTFPNASYHVQKRHWEWSQKPTERDQASFMAENLDPIKDKLKLIDGNQEIFPGIFVEMADTHTVGHQTVRVTSGGETVLHCGDLIPMSHHVRLPYVMAYDLFPLGTLEEKRKALKRATEENWTLFFEHCPSCPAAKVASGDRGFKLGEAVEL